MERAEASILWAMVLALAALVCFGVASDIADIEKRLDKLEATCAPAEAAP